MDIAKVCRICANKIKNSNTERNIFKYMRGKLLTHLKLITGVELTSDQGLPEGVCERCQSELDLAMKFRERCIFSQKYLLDIKRKEEKVKTTPAELEEQLIDADFIKAGGDFEVCDVENYDDDLSPDDDPEASVMAAAEAAHQAEVREQQLERAAKRDRNFFICELCGHFFKDEYLYNDHKEAHECRREVKDFFPCSECSLNFKKRTLLRQHRAQCHTDNATFKCFTCGEIFLSKGDKLRHQKAHENERPYPCLECGKVCRSIRELQEHCATHPPPKRKFRCEPCRKDFASRKDLMTHSRTQLHKRLVRNMEEEIEFISDS
ncbi:uncharacterized protein Dana_GF17249 [Drosophila ananassae]|uniref:Transcription factor Ouib n=1 Tax=Drosophila ananassae TaxID=7217 RepID=B3LZJ1_DROAN|nr:transcription factor Ouib [Drosophila ananassae]EDV41933.1 uncharacterized protein Dana_GF17249 [Drosophila ananassae]